MKDYKQKLKEEFDRTFCHQELSKFVPGGSHYVLNSGWTSLALWDWISIQLDELETKTRRESVKGFVDYLTKATLNGGDTAVHVRVIVEVAKEWLSTQSNIKEGK